MVALHPAGLEWVRPSHANLPVWRLLSDRLPTHRPTGSHLRSPVDRHQARPLVRAPRHCRVLRNPWHCRDDRVDQQTQTSRSPAHARSAGTPSEKAGRPRAVILWPRCVTRRRFRVKEREARFLWWFSPAISGVDSKRRNSPRLLGRDKLNSVPRYGLALVFRGFRLGPSRRTRCAASRPRREESGACPPRTTSGTLVWRRLSSRQRSPMPPNAS